MQTKIVRAPPCFLILFSGMTYIIGSRKPAFSGFEDSLPGLAVILKTNEDVTSPQKSKNKKIKSGNEVNSGFYSILHDKEIRKINSKLY